jgi:protein SCO1/2
MKSATRRRWPTLPVLALVMAGFSPTFTAAPSATSLPDHSLYHLETVWTNDTGKPFRLVELQGKARVLTMFFSRCDDICPMLTGQLKLLERELSASLRQRSGFVLVTLDPESDDAESLADHRRRMGYSRDNWILLRGRADDTRELANILGVTYMPKKEDGQIDHNGLIVILDAQGRIVEKTSSITDRAAFLKKLEKAARTTR